MTLHPSVCIIAEYEPAKYFFFFLRVFNRTMQKQAFLLPVIYNQTTQHPIDLQREFPKFLLSNYQLYHSLFLAEEALHLQRKIADRLKLFITHFEIFTSPFLCHHHCTIFTKQIERFGRFGDYRVYVGYPSDPRYTVKH